MLNVKWQLRGLGAVVHTILTPALRRQRQWSLSFPADGSRAQYKLFGGHPGAVKTACNVHTSLMKQLHFTNCPRSALRTLRYFPSSVIWLILISSFAGGSSACWVSVARLLECLGECLRGLTKGEDLSWMWVVPTHSLGPGWNKECLGSQMQPHTPPPDAL